MRCHSNYIDLCVPTTSEYQGPLTLAQISFFQTSNFTDFSPKVQESAPNIGQLISYY